MPKRNVSNATQWSERIKGHLKSMADAWSNLAGPANELIKELEAVGPGGSYPVTPALVAKLEALEKVIVRCPAVPDGPTHPCAVPPNQPKPKRRAAVRKRRPA